jgi:RimJ/RimL family protein N-acetyltransferase
MRIDTDRLTIRSFVESDIPKYAAIVADPEVTQFLGDGSPHTYEEASAYVERCIRSEAKSGIARYAVVLRETGALIGFCGFREERDCIDFGWRYARHAWGNGYATEAAAAVLDYGINTLKLSDIVCRAAVENVGSIRVMEKIGMQFEALGERRGREAAYYRLASLDRS